MPTPWITLTVAQLDTAKAATLVDALQSAALATGQGDPLPECIANVTARVRMEIAAGGRTILDADATRVPPSLKSLALRLVIAEAQSRLNIQDGLALSEDDREQLRQDYRLLERIAKGELTVEASDNPETTPTIPSGTGYYGSADQVKL